MKNLISIIIVTLLFYSCEKKYTKKFIVAKSDDNNWTTSAIIECDSVSMVDLNTAYIWINGNKMILKGQIIKIYSN